MQGGNVLARKANPAKKARRQGGREEVFHRRRQRTRDLAVRGGVHVWLHGSEISGLSNAYEACDKFACLDPARD